MTKEVVVRMEWRCGEMVPGCGTVIRGEDEEEVLAKAAEHARQEHAVEGMSEEQIRVVRSGILTSEPES